MSKNRFTTSDVKAMVRDIRTSILGQRVANIYDLSDKIYLFKFAVPGVAKKVFLLMESGMRFHTTRYNRDKNDMPSPFAMKLRKHIRLKRLEDIRQLGSDRVVDLKFGSGDSICHIILELYASGNIVLTDGNYEIIALLRSHKFEDDISVQVGEIYPIAFTTTVQQQLSSTSSDTSSNCTITDMSPSDFLTWTRERHQEMVAQNDEQLRIKSEASTVVTVNVASGGGKGGKKGNNQAVSGPKKQRAKKMNMRQLLLCKESGVAQFGPEIIDHCLLTAGLSASTKVEDFLAASSSSSSASCDNEGVSRLLKELKESAPGLLSLLDTPGQPGYILLKKSTSPVSLSPEEEASVEESALAEKKEGDYYDFVPRMFMQHQGEEYKELSSFDEAVDEYFCKVEEQRLQHHASSAEEAAKKKVKKVKEEMRSQLQGLADTQLKMEKAACLTEAFSEEVDKACLVINSAMSAGISWDDISTMVAAETAAGNPIASLIVKLKLEKNRLVIRLPDILADSDSDSDEDDDACSEGGKNQPNAKAKKAYVDVDLDLSMSAYANASKLYSQRKVARSKEEKTAVAAERAIKAVELSSSKQLVKQQVKRNLQAQRKVHWFEKFNWFISSEGYLILSGRDAQQNEQLVKKYLRAGDAYVHADMHGASSCIVRAKVKKDPVTGSETPLPISPFALNEAGTMTICRSGAWNVKVVMSAWWVGASQVSKTAPTGEYLSTGSFMIYGKKNYLPPTSLEMGFGVLFRLDDGSVLRHLSERVDKAIAHGGDIFLSGGGGGDDDDDANDDDTTPASALKSAASVGSTDKDGVKSGKSAQKSPAPSTTADGSNAVKEKKKPRKTKAQRHAEANPRGESDDEVEEVTPADTVSTDNVPETVVIKENIIKVHEENESAVRAAEDKNKSGSKAKLTPYQRKMMKKGMTLAEIEESQVAKQREKQEEESALAAAEMLKKKQAAEDDRKEEDEDEDATDATSSHTASNLGNKKKKLSKKKAKRYADQDEDDVRLAMMALGHGGKPSGADVITDSASASAAGKLSLEVSQKQAKAGVHLLKPDWSTAMDNLSAAVRDQLLALVAKKLLKDQELDPFEITTLGSFSSEEGLEILALFDCDNCAGIGNKSGFLAGIMRRFSKNKEKNLIKQRQQEQAERAGASEGNDGQEDNYSDNDNDNEGAQGGLSGAGSGAVSRGERKKAEASEIQLILQEEGVLDEQEGKLADELEKLTGMPLSSDVLLYAVPVCGPFSALKNLKYKVKLTPGTIKKGKACKNAIEVFTNSKNYTSVPTGTGTGTGAGGVAGSGDGVAAQAEATSKERALIRGLTDPEMVAIMIGDVKLSMPGLYSTLKKKKEQSKKGKKNHE